MIYSFLYHERVVNIVPIGVREGALPNIYESDSMTLVVGPNNSGKTELLAQLCRAIASRDQTALEIDGDIEDVGVVYFSPASFRKSRFPQRYPRVKVISQKGVDVSTDGHEIVRRLRDDFGFTGRLVVKLKHSPVDAVRALLARAMEIPSRIPRFSELDKLVENYQKASMNWRSEEIESSPTSRERQEAMNFAQRELRLGIQYLVEERLGHNANVYLIALAVLLAKGRRSKQLAQEFFECLNGRPWSDGFMDTVSTVEGVSAVYTLEELIVGVDVAWHQQADFLDEGSILSVELDGLSSGAEALVAQFVRISSAVRELSNYGSSKIILLIDEGDAFLHIAWQQLYIKVLDDFAKSICPNFATIQVVVATHSPVLMSDFPRDFILRVSPDSGGVAEGELVSFAAPLENIVASTAGAGSIGKKATQIIRRELERGRAADMRIIDWIDDPLLRKYLMEQIEHAG
ncbi:ATP-binding protein [Stenotrophomonas maltophilia]|nr:ATP-binding protein [Stenotrophomonas maltophilia]